MAFGEFSIGALHFRDALGMTAERRIRATRKGYEQIDALIQGYKPGAVDCATRASGQDARESRKHRKRYQRGDERPMPDEAERDDAHFRAGGFGPQRRPAH